MKGVWYVYGCYKRNSCSVKTHSLLTILPQFKTIYTNLVQNH